MSEAKELTKRTKKQLEKIEQEAELMMRRAISHLILSQQFFGALALKLRVRINWGIPTAATDGVHLMFNPEFISKFTDDERVAIVAHEVLHCAFLHMTRRGERDPIKWNVAGDFCINLVLVDSGFKLPKGALLDEKYRDMSVDHVYTLLPDPEVIVVQFGGKGDGNGNGEDLGGMGGVIDAPKDGTGQSKGNGENGGSEGTEKTWQGGSGMTPAEMEADWTVAVSQAAQAAKMAGNLPAALDRLVGKLMAPKVDWKAALRRFIQATSKSDYTWKRPNRKYIQEGFFLPSLYGERIGELVVAIDTSGSIGEKELDVFASELSAILDETDPQNVYLLWVDAEVAGAEEVTKADLPLELKPKGGGGTAFSPAFAWVEERGIAPVAFIYLTDLCCNDFGEPPPYPVLWISTTERNQVPFGDVVEIQVEAA